MKATKKRTRKNLEVMPAPVGEGIRMRGFFRLNIITHHEDGTSEITGDTGWRENQICNTGYDNYLSRVIGALAGSSLASYAALGTGTAPASSSTGLPGELTDAAGCRCTLASSTTGSKTVQFTFNLASNIITAARTINNVGLFAVSTTAVGSIFAGNTYATSSLATNQSVNGSYQIQFA
jgi:hypothetical protein